MDNNYNPDYVGNLVDKTINRHMEEKAATDLAIQQKNTELRNVQETLARNSANNQVYTPMNPAMAPEVLNPQLQLTPGQGKKTNPTVTQAAIQGTAQAANSNQEEYQTVARSAAKEKLQDAVIVTSLGVNASVFQSYQEHKDTALAYAYNKGALAANEARGQQLCQTLNNINPMQRYQMDYSYDSFRKQAGHIYTETLRGADGKLHVTRENSAGNYMEKSTGIDLSTKIGDKTANEVLSDIGKFYEQDKKLNTAVEVLKGHAVAGNTTTASWENLVSGNFAALNEKFNFTDRYNKMLDNTMFEQGIKKYAVDPHIRDFRGTEEEVNKLRNAVDASGNALFTTEELSELEECVNACGYGTDSAVHTSMLNASMMARRKLAKNSLEETQLAGFNTLSQAAKVCGTTKMVADTARDLGREMLANSAEKKTVKMLDTIANKNTAAGKLEEAKARLAKKKEKLGINTNEELLGKMRQRREVASEIKQRRRDIRRATTGMDKTQARLVVNELRQQEMLLKKGKSSKRLNKRTEKLQKKLQRQRALRAAVKKHAPHLVKAVGKVKGSAPMQLLGNIHNKTAVAKAGMQKFLLKLIPPIAGGMLIIVIACGAIAIVVGSFLMFIEFNGNTDAEGKEANDLQIVNEGMSEYESNQLDALKQHIVSAYQDTADKSRGVPSGIPEDAVNGRYTKSVEIIPEYEIYNEYGMPTGICNCMQLVSLYRYYYIFMNDEDGEAEDTSFWLNDFKSGRMTDAWDATHCVVSGSDKNHLDTWKDILDDSNGKLKSKVHPDAIEYRGDGCGRYEYDVPVYDEDGNFVEYQHSSMSVCCGHQKVTADVQVDEKLENIAENKRLKTKSGKQIAFEQEDMDTLNDYLSALSEEERNIEWSKQDGGAYVVYEQGYQLYQDWEVYFGCTKNMFSDAEIADLLAKIEEANGPLSEQQIAVITTALSGCGKFTYSMGSHANCKKGVRGGATDCSGFVSWVHNNCGLYNNEDICNTTTAWSLAPGHKTNDPSALKPGDIVIKGAPGDASASEGNSNHVVIYLGKIKNEKTGQLEDWIVECGGSAGGSGAHAATNFKSYKTWVPLGSSDVW